MLKQGLWKPKHTDLMRTEVHAKRPTFHHLHSPYSIVPLLLFKKKSFKRFWTRIDSNKTKATSEL